MIQTEKKPEPISHVLTSTFQIVSHFPEQTNKLLMSMYSKYCCFTHPSDYFYNLDFFPIPQWAVGINQYLTRREKSLNPWNSINIKTIFYFLKFGDGK